MSSSGRDVLVDAVRRVVAREGLDAATVRRVATESGVSIGAVQHHFPTKGAMLRAAMEAVGVAFRERAERATDGHEAGPALRALVAEMLPLDDRRRDEGRVWLAFVARAAVDETLRVEHAREWAEVENVIVALLAGHRDRPQHDDERERADARLLLAVLDGLAVGGLVEPERLAPQRIRAVVDPLLDELLGEKRSDTATTRSR